MRRKQDRKLVRAVARATGASRRAARKLLRRIEAQGGWLSSVRRHPDGRVDTVWVRGQWAPGAARLLFLLRLEGLAAADRQRLVVPVESL